MRDTTAPFVTLGDTANRRRVTAEAPCLRAFIDPRDTRDTEMGVDTSRARKRGYMHNRVTECHASHPTQRTHPLDEHPALQEQTHED